MIRVHKTRYLYDLPDLNGGIRVYKNTQGLHWTRVENETESCVAFTAAIKYNDSVDWVPSITFAAARRRFRVRRCIFFFLLLFRIHEYYFRPCGISCAARKNNDDERTNYRQITTVGAAFFFFTDSRPPFAAPDDFLRLCVDKPSPVRPPDLIATLYLHVSAVAVACFIFDCLNVRKIRGR